MHRYSLINYVEIEKIVGSVVLFENEVIFDNKESARFCGYKFMEANEKVFASAETIFFHTMIAKAIKIGLRKGILNEEDLFKTDGFVKNKLIKSQDRKIMKLLDLISKDTLLVACEENYDLHLRVKTRLPDPKYLDNGRVFKLSEVDSDFCNAMNEASKRGSDGHRVQVKHSGVLDYQEIAGLMV